MSAPLRPLPSPVSRAPEPEGIYLEVTNRCNLYCQTCTRTFNTVEPPADLTYDHVVRLVEEFPSIRRATLHGIGEPLMNKDLIPMIQFLTGRGIHVLFNTNGILLTRAMQGLLIDAGLDECRVSLDAATPKTFLKIRGLDRFDRIIAQVKAFVALKEARGVTHPTLSLWFVGLRENLEELPDFVRLAHHIGVPEVYYQRLVFDEEGHEVGLARADQAMYEAIRPEEEAVLRASEALAAELGVQLRASGDSSPVESLAARGRPGYPWSSCHRPFTVPYVTANGNVLPCCIAPFAHSDYKSLILGNAFGEGLRSVWEGPTYQEFRERIQGPDPHPCCRNCGIRWSL